MYVTLNLKKNVFGIILRIKKNKKNKNHYFPNIIKIYHELFSHEHIFSLNNIKY